MTIDDDQQAVATESDDSPGEGAEDKGAQGDDLDASLKEFDQETAQTEEKPTDPPKPDEADDEMAGRVAAIENRFVSEDLSKAVASVKGDHNNLAGVSDDIIEARMRLESSRNPDFEKAFLNQAGNPDGFRKVMKSLGEKIAKEVGAVADPQLTKDRDAMRTAVNTQSTSTTAPDGSSQAEVQAMSDEDFDAHMQAGFRA